MNLTLIEAAATSGCHDSQVLLGFLYESGVIACSDKKQAEKWYQVAAKGGVALAQYAYADLISSDRITEAMRWFKKAADQNYSPAEYMLGVIFQHGISVAKNADTALDWFTKSANNKNYLAAETLGNIYEFGVGAMKDVEKSLNWYLKAADLGSGRAAFILAGKYKDGVDVVKNDETALNLYHRAAELGRSSAHGFLAMVYKEGLFEVKPDNFKSAYHAKKMIECGEVERKHKKFSQGKVLFDMSGMNKGE